MLSKKRSIHGLLWSLILSGLGLTTGCTIHYDPLSVDFHDHVFETKEERYFRKDCQRLSEGRSQKHYDSDLHRPKQKKSFHDWLSGQSDSIE